jgi:zinc protease
MNIKKFGSGTIHELTLSNGMRLVVVPTHARPRVLVQMVYDVGASSEADEEKGLAHLLEHMIFKGTPRLQEGAIWKIAARYGANMNAFTANDMTSYFFEVDSNNWKPFVSVLADCMENVLLSSEHLASEVKAVIQELRMRNDNPAVTLYEALFENALPKDHPYYVPLIGYKKDLAAMTADRLKAFYNKYYVPERATLFVVGDVVVEDVVAEVERTFAQIPASGKTFSSVFTKEYPKKTGFHLTFPKHWLKPNTFLAWPLPASFDERVDVAQMTAQIMGEGPQSRLYKRLVDTDQSADNVGCGIYRLGNEAFLLVSYQPREGRADDCVRAVVDEIETLAEKPVDAAELSRLIKSTLVRHEMALENPTQALLGYELLVRYVKTGSIDAAFTIGERLQAVTPEKVQALVEQYITPKIMIRLDSVPMNEEQKTVWLADQQKDQELEQQILANHVRTTPIPTDIVLPEQYSMAKPIAVPIPRATQRFELDNGFKIIVTQEADTNLCAFLLGNINSVGMDKIQAIKVGVMSQLFIEGAAGFTKQQIIDWFNDRGVQQSVGAGFAVCLRQDFKDVFRKIFDILRNPDFVKGQRFLSKIFGSNGVAEQAFEKVKLQTIQQYKSFYDHPQMVAEFEQTSRKYKGTGYGYTLEEVIKALHEFTFSELPDLYKKFMNPAVRVLSVAGNVESQEVFKLAKECMSDLKALPAEKLGDAVVAQHVPSFDVAMNRDQVYLLYVRESKLPASELSVERVAIDILSAIFLSGGTSRIFKLREATGICYMSGGVLGAPIATGFHRSQDSVLALVSPERLDEACKLFESFIQSVFKSTISQQELDDARHKWRSTIANSALGALGLASHFITLEMYKRDELYRQKYLEILDSLTPQILEEISSKYLEQGQFVRVRVGNIPTSSN